MKSIAENGNNIDDLFENISKEVNWSVSYWLGYTDKISIKHKTK